MNGVQAFDFLRSALRPKVLPTVLPGDEALLKSYGHDNIPEAVMLVPGWASALTAPLPTAASAARVPIFVPMTRDSHVAATPPSRYPPFNIEQPPAAAWEGGQGEGHGRLVMSKSRHAAVCLLGFPEL